MVYSGNAKILDDSPSGKTLEAVGALKDEACVRPVALLIAYIVQLASRRGSRSLPVLKKLPD